MAEWSGMLALERADRLRHEADIVMQKIRLLDTLEAYGKVFPTGSYFLDVMAYPDIDLYLTKVSLKQLFEIGARLAGEELVTQVVFEKTDDAVDMPDGLYLKPRINYGEWGRPWKIDIWSLEEHVILKKMAEMRHFLDQMGPVLRERIIRYKLSVMTAEKRTPKYSGHFIYKAFIDEGLTDFEEVNQYLEKSGIRVNGL